MNIVNRIGLLGWLILILVTVSHPDESSWEGLALQFVLLGVSSLMLLYNSRSQ